jgi:hypothetical protein
MAQSPVKTAGAWPELGRRLRLALDYLRYLDPRYAATPHLGDRARDRAPRVVVRLTEAFSSERARGRLRSILSALERGLPRNTQATGLIRAQAPDAVLITPLVDLGSPQLDYLAAAKALGCRTVLPVGSWDHLSSKSLLRSIPDRVLVWNETQRAEALHMHGISPERVVVTGAQCYDQWWGRMPSRSRAAFAARVGLRSDKPFVLYVCSSLFRGTASEPDFVLNWVQALRSSADPRLKDIGILIRPHPSRLDEWHGVDLSEYRNLTMWGAHPVDAEAKDDYFDSLYYSAAVVGLNTSAFLEAAVVGKPVLTITLPEISAFNQEGTLHFRYLLTVGGGLLRVASGFDEHLRMLADSLAGDGGGDARAQQFAQAFIRPFGVEQAATPRFVDAIEQVATLPAPAPENTGAAPVLLRLPLYPLAAVLALHLRTQWWRKYTRNRLRKDYKAWKRRVLVDLKQFATRGLRRAPRTVVTPPPSALTPKLGRHRDPAKRLSGWDVEEAKDVRELVTMLGRGQTPVIVGPWLSETGFELLYWIPFLNWAKHYGNLHAEQLLVISRGGAAPWYSHLTTNYHDVLSIYTPEEFRRKNDERIAAQHGRLKHLDVSAFDQEIIKRVTQERRLSGAKLLHPSEMYRLFEHFWFQRAPVTLVEAFTSFAAMPPPREPSPIPGQLPARYVAAKFYGNSALPETPENRRFIAGFLENLTEHADVVLLNTGHRYDDHEDFAPSARGRIHTVEHLMTPQTNLAVQTEIIRNAQAFVGTYGGFSYLAPLLGVDALAFYSHPTGFRFDHLEVAKRVFSGLRCGSFVELDVRATDVVKLGFGGSLRAAVGSR